MAVAITLTSRAGTIMENLHTSVPSGEICPRTSDTTSMINVNLPIDLVNPAEPQSHTKISSHWSISTRRHGRLVDGPLSPKIKYGLWLGLMPDTVLREVTVLQLVATL